VPVCGWSNHAKLSSFIEQVRPRLDAGQYDLVIGFNKMPGLDLYYAADPCYLDRVKRQFSYPLRRLFGRVKFYAQCENTVFGEDSHTVSMMISEPQKRLFEKHYRTPASRLVDLPPGIDPDRRRPDDWRQQRVEFRGQLGLQATDFLLLMVGTGFRTKGVDRAIDALAALPESRRRHVRLMIVGDGEPGPWQRQARKLNIDDRVTFLGGRDDVPRFLLAADLLLHPARKENTGTVILEAMVAGLPVLVTGVCGYASHVIKSGAGEIITQPDNPQDFAGQLALMLDREKLEAWSENGLRYAASEDLYSMPQRAAALIGELAEKQGERAY
jgi:UDP-glucose:(heptosyl)LPS alpha-1,3-glucosyltransferase